MKKPKTVADAEAALAAKAAEVTAAKQALNQLEIELRAAHDELRRAQVEADAALPQCRVIRVWHGRQEGTGIQHVIVRRTPGGMLVVRAVGAVSDPESRFKWSKHAERYLQAERAGLLSRIRELVDVPAEYLPAGNAAQN